MFQLFQVKLDHTLYEKKKKILIKILELCMIKRPAGPKPNLVCEHLSYLKKESLLQTFSTNLQV